MDHYHCRCSRRRRRDCNHGIPRGELVGSTRFYSIRYVDRLPQPWAAAIAVGMAIGVMHMTDSFHPPAGINLLLIVLNDRSWSFLIVPVGAGLIMLVGFAYAWHNLVRRGSWPNRWW
jgi:CBS-domain-containing membrane protein